MRQATKRRLRIVFGSTLASMAGGALYGWLAGAGTVGGTLRGVCTGLVIAGGLSSFEIFGMRSPLGLALRRRPFSQFLIVKTAIYLAVITAGEAFSAYGLRALLNQSLAALVIALVFNFVMQINVMLGQGELVKFMRGRYSRPREEERIFLFLDLVDSTSLAEAIGGVRFLAFLNLVYDDIADVILEHRGEIHKYVGDEVIVTWTPAVGLPGAACIACALAIEEQLAAGTERYRAQFGVVPRFRCGLHLGLVASGELGSVKREIAYLGDAMNTTARLIEACRSEQRSVIASDALVGRVALPATVAAEPLGALSLRGKQEKLRVHALSRRR